MNTVITEKQARQITGGRKPLVPVEYESAVKALQACSTLDESKYWSDKADALAAWAKIYSDDSAAIEARRLKLHAYRRMGQLASELRPRTYTHSGQLPGPHALLVSFGLKKEQATCARRLSTVSEEKFTEMIERPRPPSPVSARKMVAGGSDAWREITFPPGPATWRPWCRRIGSASVFARKLQGDELARARELVKEIIDWLDEFEQALYQK